MDVDAVTSPYRFLLGRLEAEDHGQIVKLGQRGVEPRWVKQVGAIMAERTTPVNQEKRPLNTPL